jgi:hypothetical protein
MTFKISIKHSWLSFEFSFCYAECHYAECHYAERHYAECHYAKCRYAECRYAECCGAFQASLMIETRTFVMSSGLYLNDFWGPKLILNCNKLECQSLPP